MPTEIKHCKSYLESINTVLDELLPIKEADHSQLYEAARYAVLGPGKRIRPLLCISVARTLRVPLEFALQPAAALEFVHCYSLIHDDLPCMDNDDFRRGRPTLHRAYPEGLAVLTGDYLLTYAFEILSNAPHLDDTTKVRLMRILAECAGGEGMVGGQVRDIHSVGKEIQVDQLRELHRRKTGRLLNASILFGAVIARTGKEIYHTLNEVGDKVGLLFQIVDDILDITQSEEKHGKMTSSDEVNNKTTYATLLGVEGARKEVSCLVSQIKDLLLHIPYNTADLFEIIESIANRCH